MPIVNLHRLDLGLNARSRANEGQPAMNRAKTTPRQFLSQAPAFHHKGTKTRNYIRDINSCLGAFVLSSLEVQLQSKLELPRVEGGGWAAVVATVRGALVERPHVVDEW